MLSIIHIIYVHNHLLVDIAREFNNLVEWTNLPSLRSACELHFACGAGAILSQVGSFLGPGRDFIAKSEVGGRAAWTLQDAQFGVIRSASNSKAHGAAQAHRK